MKKWYIHTMGYYSAMKRNGIEYFVEMHVGLFCHTEQSQKDKSEREKQIFYVDTCMWNLENSTNRYR